MNKDPKWDPSSATHMWTAAAHSDFLIRLSRYKKVGKVWWVFSDMTGWRLSGNTEEWFKGEKAEGFFIKIKKADHVRLAEGN